VGICCIIEVLDSLLPVGRQVFKGMTTHFELFRQPPGDKK